MDEPVDFRHSGPKQATFVLAGPLARTFVLARPCMRRVGYSETVAAEFWSSV